MKWILVFLCLAAPAAAQSPLFPEGTVETRAVPHWRIGASAGATDAATTALASVSVERTVRGPASAGARVALYLGEGFADDAPSTEGALLEAFGSVGTRDRFLDLRVLAGGAAGVLNYDPGPCFAEPADCPEPEASGPSPAGYVFVGAGLDVYAAPWLGVGLEARLAPSFDVVNHSSVEVGLRVRLPG